MEKYIAVIPRADENRVAVVTYKSSKELNQNSMMDLLVKAITEWVSNTADGEHAWKDSQKDFNVGDLSCFLGYWSLDEMLHANDIWELKVDICGNGDYPTNYNFDTVLAQPEE